MEFAGASHVHRNARSQVVCQRHSGYVFCSYAHVLHEAQRAHKMTGQVKLNQRHSFQCMLTRAEGVPTAPRTEPCLRASHDRTCLWTMRVGDVPYKRYFMDRICFSELPMPVLEPALPIPPKTGGIQVQESLWKNILSYFLLNQQALVSGGGPFKPHHRDNQCKQRHPRSCCINETQVLISCIVTPHYRATRTIPLPVHTCPIPQQ